MEKTTAKTGFPTNLEKYVQFLCSAIPDRSTLQTATLYN